MPHSTCHIYFSDGPLGTDLHVLSMRLADTPCGPLSKSTSFPNSEARLRLLDETPKWLIRERHRKSTQ